MLNKKAHRYLIGKARLAWKFYDDARKGCLSGTKCVDCSKRLSANDKRADHISPVVLPETGFAGWDRYYDRLFCGPEGLQLLCIKCHDAKSAKENEQRREQRRKRK